MHPDGASPSPRQADATCLHEGRRRHWHDNESLLRWRGIALGGPLAVNGGGRGHLSKKLVDVKRGMTKTPMAERSGDNEAASGWFQDVSVAPRAHSGVPSREERVRDEGARKQAQIQRRAEAHNFFKSSNR